jgi:hypothetical protein
MPATIAAPLVAIRSSCRELNPRQGVDQFAPSSGVSGARLVY